MSESGNEGTATPRSLVSSVIRALSATMGSGGNRNSRMIVAASNESLRGQDPRDDELEERSAETCHADAERYVGKLEAAYRHG